jgi:heat shock protein 90kDa beta
VKRLLQTLSKLADNAAQAAANGADEEDADRLAFWRVSQVYNNVLKLAAIEDAKNRDKAAALVRFATNQRNETSLDQVRVLLGGSFCMQ